MHKRYPVDQDGNSTQSDDRHEDEHDHADADHLSRITEEQLRVKAEDRDDDNVIKPFYLGKSSARGLLAQVVQAKNQSRTPASSASPASSSERDMQTENDPTSTLSLLVAHGGHIDLPGESLCAGFDVEMDGKGMGSLECQPEDFMSRSRPEYWQMPPVSDCCSFCPLPSLIIPSGRGEASDTTTIRGTVQPRSPSLNLRFSSLSLETTSSTLTPSCHSYIGRHLRRKSLRACINETSLLVLLSSSYVRWVQSTRQTPESSFPRQRCGMRQKRSGALWRSFGLRTKTT